MVKVSGASFVCEGCRTAYPSRDEAAVCEQRHDLMQRWREGKVDDLAVAQGLGLPVDTPENKAISLRSVRNMLQKGADTSLKAETLVGVTMREAPPLFVGTTRIHGDGRTQIPAAIRSAWGAKDDDFVHWYRQGDTIILVPHQQVAAPHRQPHFVGPTRELPSPP